MVSNLIAILTDTFIIELTKKSAELNELVQHFLACVKFVKRKNAVGIGCLV
jgi:hypothetical protein